MLLFQYCLFLFSIVAGDKTMALQEDGIPWIGLSFYGVALLIFIMVLYSLK